MYSVLQYRSKLIHASKACEALLISMHIVYFLALWTFQYENICFLFIVKIILAWVVSYKWM